MSTRIFHISTKAEAQAAAASGTYTHPSLGEEGFIHCSRLDQLLVPANERYRGRGDLVVLVVDEAAVGNVIYEDSYGSGMEFPHVYSSIDWAHVRRVVPFPCGDDGRFSLPVLLLVEGD